jgi:hypothetical protein
VLDIFGSVGHAGQLWCIVDDDRNQYMTSIVKLQIYGRRSECGTKSKNFLKMHSFKEEVKDLKQPEDKLIMRSKLQKHGKISSYVPT